MARRASTSSAASRRASGDWLQRVWPILALLVLGLAIGGWFRLHRTGAAPVRPADRPSQSPAAPAGPANASRPAPAAAAPAPRPAAAVEFRLPDPADIYPREPVSPVEIQIALARQGYSCGSIDGKIGAQTAAALLAFQEEQGLRPLGWVDAATRAALLLDDPPLARTTLTAADLARLQPVGKTWLAKSAQSALEYETALELLAERTHAHPELLKRLNPDVAWPNPPAGTAVWAPAIARPPKRSAAQIHVRLADHVLQVRDADGRLIAHFPVSIARDVEKRPVGELHVVVAAPNPNYTFNPAVFPESPEAQEIGRKLILPPGPNNPVGLAWIGLDRPGYGIHGTPHPEQVGRTESHGCFRLANWDATYLLDLVWPGLPVYVDP